ncbi:sensor histidine kinase [Desulfovibrio litoralis]|uniref:histidine kinase n=1 Tax=Desulfovibrio litoralis DSM 11393 TaxID=1121455 RepID=A0A1M7TEW4_9BACT|nr:ATP-binding protein [Desulfovibrio litoralis]SHN69237.1 Histidine kinase-, DNA gyrase B-, and HSP90-like ATPase [Desulfovibrio litoralis DSM 11393]
MKTDKVKEKLLVDEEFVSLRIKDKINDFNNYAFSKEQSYALNIFFDLAQEFNSTDRLYTLAVLVADIFFDLESQLFVLDSIFQHNIGTTTTPSLILKASTVTQNSDDLKADELIELMHQKPNWFKEYFCCPIIGKNCIEGSSDKTSCEAKIGIFAFKPKNNTDKLNKLYCEKYTNRVGVQLHNRILSTQNLMHISFVKKLVHDIGHNVIVPNMYFKLLIQQLYSKIENLSHLKYSILREKPSYDEITGDIHALHQSLEEQYTEIYHHFQQTSLFLEALLRQSHFDQGRYVLNCSQVSLMEKIILPQLERYTSRMKERNILLTLPEYDLATDQDIIVSADIGLLSQVMANFLSNAVKYTQPTPTSNVKKVRCTVEILPNHFKDQESGVKVSLISSGPLIDQEDAVHLFEDNFRASNSKNENGTGHGLHFVKEMIAQHSGEIGYEVIDNSNSFYFILPCSTTTCTADL